MKNLKNWLLVIVGILLVIADQGFDFINPFLIEIGTPPKWIGYIKIAFAIYGLVKVKKSLPTQNIDKLQYLIDKKSLAELEKTQEQ